MQIVSAQEKAVMEQKREDLFKLQIEVQERIRKAAALGDLSENAEYHFAKEENRNIQRQLAELETKLKTVSVVATDDVPEDMVFLGHTVKLMDLDDESEQLVRLVGEAVPPDAGSDVLPVSVSSPMGDALMKARVGDTVKVRIESGKAARDATVTLALPPENPPRDVTVIAGRNPLAGAKVENLSPAAALDLQTDLLAKGVVIVSINPSSFSGNYGFRPGDIVRSVNNIGINRVTDLNHALNGVNHWDLVIERGGRSLRLSVDG